MYNPSDKFRQNMADTPLSSEPATESSSLLTANGSDDIQEHVDADMQHNLELAKGPILLSLWLGSFLSSLDGTVVANSMNSIAEGFEESNKKLWIATSYLLTNTAFQPLYGKLSDTVGRKPALLMALISFGFGCLLTACATNVWQFSLARAICGIGGGGISAMSSITVCDICTARERGIYQGYANIVYGMGQLLGGPLGGFFVETIGWRAVFILQVPMIALCSFLACKYVNIKLSHIPPSNKRLKWENLARIDMFGSLALVSTITAFLCICSTNLNRPLLALITISGLLLFLWIEMYYARERILPFETLKGSFGLCALTALTSSYIVFAEVFRSPIYLQVYQNLSVTAAGIILMFPSIAVAIGSLITGWILRTTKQNLTNAAYQLIFIGVLLQGTGIAMSYGLVKQLDPSMSTAGTKSIIKTLHSTLISHSHALSWQLPFIISGTFIGYGYATLLVATLVVIVSTVHKSQQGTVTGIFYLARSMGNVLGVSLTLAAYENNLASKLWDFMFHYRNNDYSYTFTEKEYNKLVRDSGYLRSHFPLEVMKDLLGVYKSAFLFSYSLSIGCLLFGLLISWQLFHQASHKKHNPGPSP